MKFLARMILVLTIASYALAGLPPTTSRISGESADVTTFSFKFPNFAGTRSGTSLTLGTLSVAGGGTGSTSLTQYGVLLGNGTSAVGVASPSTSGYPLLSTGASSNPAFGQLSLTAGVTGVLPIANGGTNSSTALNNNRIMQSSSGGIVEAAAITASRALASDANGIPVASATTATELGYVSGVTSAIQTQLNAKAPTASPTFSGTITTPLTASRALTTGASSELAVSATTSTELGYVSGVTSAIQTQLNGKASTTLNNLGTTAINAALIPSAADTHNIGNSTTGFNFLYTKIIRVGGNSYSLNLSGGAENQGMPSGTSVTGLISQQAAGRLGLSTSNSSSATASSDIQIETGNNSSTGGSGNIYLTAGTVVSGTRGVIGMVGSAVGVLTASPASSLHVNGSYQGLVTALSADTTLGTHQYVTVDASGGAKTITLPDCTSTILGRTYHIKKIDSSANAVNIARTGADDTFDGSTSYAFNTQYQSITLVCVSTTLWGIF